MQKLSIIKHFVALSLIDLLPRSIQLWRKQVLLKKQLKYVSNHFPFFRALADQKRLRLEEFPITDKATYIRHFEQLNSEGFSYSQLYQIASQQEESRNFSSLHKGYTIGLSSGTSGNPGIILVSDKERAVWVATIFKRVIGLQFKKRKVAFFLRANSTLYESVNSSLIQFEYFDLSQKMDELALKLNQYQPDIIVAPATVLQNLSENPTININTVQQVISVAEVLDELSRKAIVKRFPDALISQVYQATEGFLAYTCKKGNIHLNETQVHFELEPIQTDAPNDRRRQIIITDFTRKVQPVIRYRMGDIVQLSHAPCNCGDSSQTIDAIEGRNEDCLKFKSQDNKDVILFPDLVRQWLVRASQDISDFRVIQTGAYDINIQLLISEDQQASLQQAISKQFTQFQTDNHLNQNIHLTFKPFEPSTNLLSKHRRVVNQYQS